MFIISDDKSPNDNIVIEDSYDKLNIDILLLTERVKILKSRRKNTPWYRVGTRLKLRKELSCIERESDEIAERLLRLHEKDRNPIQIVKRV